MERISSSRLQFGKWSDNAECMSMAESLWLDPAVTRLIGGPFDRSWVAARLEREIRSYDQHGVQYCPLFTKISASSPPTTADREFVGVCGFHVKDLHEISASHNYTGDYWSSGYATEAALAAMNWAKTVLGVRLMYAGHHPQNEASKHVLLKLGFKYSHDETYPPTGLSHKCYMLDLAE
ncbi:GNAT family N-acetyltransferase [Pelomyxa schiedti]|nr:GNAT family N-acetyltransferase [Pelomyxa schiedti]